MGLGNRVIVREKMKYKSHDHVKKTRAFSKGRTRSELMITPIKGTLIKSRYELVFRYSPQTITTRVVRMRYLQDVEHIGYNIKCDHNVRTSNVSKEEVLNDQSHACWSKILE